MARAPTIRTAVPASEVGLLAPNTNARVRPTVDPSLDMSLLGGQQGYQFVTNKGKPAKTKEGASGFVPLIPDAQYRLVNKQGRDAVAASGVGQQGLQDVYATAQRLSAEGGKKAQWEVEMLDPATGTWSQVARDPKGGFGALGTVMDIGLPIAGSLLLPGLGTGLSAALAGGLGAAAGAATSGVIQGKSLENIALQAALSGGLSFAGGELLGQASGGLGSGATEATQAAASEATQGILSEAAKQAAQQALGDVIIVPGIREAATSVLPAAIGAGLGGAGASALSNLASAAPRGAEGDIIEVVGQPNQPVMPAPTVPNLEDLLGAPTAIAPVLDTVKVPETPAEKPSDVMSTVDDIRTWMNRIGTASTLLGVLGDAVGGTGGVGATTPYTSVLGPAPSFGRGAFTPYTGNYETYGFGPEFSFFGQAPAQTTTGPMASLLNPALPVNNTLLA